MKVLIALLSITIPALAGIIHDHQEHEVKEEDHKQATSYQSIHIEHFHPIPTIFKKEYEELWKHPIPSGNTKSNLQIHHGGKHDYGYAISSVESDLNKGYDFGGDHQEYKETEYKDYKAPSEDESAHRQEEHYDYSHYHHAQGREHENEDEYLHKAAEDHEPKDEEEHQHHGLGHYKS